MKFVKMHGLGNDFLIFDCLENGDSEHAPVWLTAERVQQRIGWSDLCAAINGSGFSNVDLQCRWKPGTDVWKWYSLCRKICI